MIDKSVRIVGVAMEALGYLGGAAYYAPLTPVESETLRDALTPCTQYGIGREYQYLNTGAGRRVLVTIGTHRVFTRSKFDLENERVAPGILGNNVKWKVFPARDNVDTHGNYIREMIERHGHGGNS